MHGWMRWLIAGLAIVAWLGIARADVICVEQDAETSAMAGPLHERPTACKPGEVEIGKVLDAEAKRVDFDGRVVDLPGDMPVALAPASAD